MAVTVITRKRAGRRTNIALLIVLPVAFGTGWLAFGTGALWPARVVTVTHAVAGIAVLALTPWKQLIARRGLARPDAHRPARSILVKALSVALVVSVMVSLAAGFAHSYAGPGTYAGLTAMQIHVGAAIVAVPLFVAHLFTRPQRLAVSDLSRRNVLRFGALLAVGAVSYAALEGVSSLAGLPGRRRRTTGSYERGAGDPAAMPVTSWLFDEIPVIAPATYSVLLGSRRVAYDDLAAGSDEVSAILDCTGGWYSEQTWRGVRVDRVLPSIPHGHVIVVTSVTGYQRRFPAAEAPMLWLATHAGGIPLDPGHGAPARLVAPNRRGFWWVKWVASIHVERGPDWWQPPFPMQ